MKLTRDFHPSQVMLIFKVQQYTAYGRGACYSVVIMLMLALPFANNNFAKGAIYLSQLAAFATGFKLEHLKKLIADDHHEVSLSRSTQGISSHFEASYAPPKRDVVVMETAKPMPSHPVLKALYEQKLECNLVGELKSPSFVRTMVKPLNCTASKVLNVGRELQLDLALDAPPIMSISKGAIAIDTPRSDRQIARFADYWKPSQKIEAAIGVNINNQLVSIDLSQPETCHILFAGMTGSGKSVWSQSLLLSLLIGQSPQEVQLVICDPKYVSFVEFDDCANLLVPIINTPEEYIYVGNWLIENMEARYQTFKNFRVENAEAYNKIVPTSERYPTLIFFTEEYGDLKAACYTGKEKKEGDKIWSQILNINIRLGQKARAADIHEIIGSQKAVNVIDKQIRSNLPARVLLKVLEEGDTECLLGNKTVDGRDLLGRGDLFFNGDRFQSLLCEPSDFAKLNKGKPVYQLEDLVPQTIDVLSKTVKSDHALHDLTTSELREINGASQITAPALQAIINFLDGRDWQRDNYIKQSVRLLKEKDEPIETIQGYLQYLEVQGILETRNAGRNGLEAKLR